LAVWEILYAKRTLYFESLVLRKGAVKNFFCVFLQTKPLSLSLSLLKANAQCVIVETMHAFPGISSKQN